MTTNVTASHHRFIQTRPSLWHRSCNYWTTILKPMPRYCRESRVKCSFKSQKNKRISKSSVSDRHVRDLINKGFCSRAIYISNLLTALLPGGAFE